MYIQNSTSVPVNMVGSSIFGRYKKISAERTINLFISDNWLVNYAGFKARLLLNDQKGRGLFDSVHGNFTIAVSGSSVFKITPAFEVIFIGNLETNKDEVVIAENLSAQICIVDGQNAWIYNYLNETFVKQTLEFAANPIAPGYVSYHNSFFLIAPSPISINPQNWYAFQMMTGEPDKIELVTQFSLQTKTDTALAVIPMPGEGNNVMVLGSIVSEVWTQVGDVQNYVRVSSYNVDYGTVSRFTIGASDTMIVWIAKNSNSTPSLMVSSGSQSERISTDGIDEMLKQIQHPEQSTAIFFRMDGHLFYQFTFFHPDDNITLLYDFTTKKFYDVCDNQFNYHPARQIVYINNKQYFVSINDGKLYQMATDLTTYGYNIADNVKDEVIPRSRIPKTIRIANGKRFCARRYTFWLEQGVASETYPYVGDSSEPIDRPYFTLSLSKNGNQTFGTPVNRYFNKVGHYQNQIHWDRMGQANELTLQINFWTKNRVVANDGELEITL